MSSANRLALCKNVLRIQAFRTRLCWGICSNAIKIDLCAVLLLKPSVQIVPIYDSRLSAATAVTAAR